MHRDGPVLQGGHRDAWYCFRSSRHRHDVIRQDATHTTDDATWQEARRRTTVPSQAFHFGNLDFPFGQICSFCISEWVLASAEGDVPTAPITLDGF